MERFKSKEIKNSMFDPMSGKPIRYVLDMFDEGTEEAKTRKCCNSDDIDEEVESFKDHRNWQRLEFFNNK